MQVESPFKEAIIRKYPEQVVIVLARDRSGRINPITLGWTMLTSNVPPMMAFSVGIRRYSLEVLRAAKECVIAFPSELQTQETLLFGTKSGRDTDKINDSGISVIQAKQVDCVLIKDAVANFECRLTGEFPTGDHVIFFGEIIVAHVNPHAPGRLYTVGKGYKMSGITVNQK
ncbi:MAG: flavin reductase family protein [Candidatus Latescibacteria bacterium]|nr:flavin reductase family protein [Candidatus Latescibacterota bacterium]